MSEAVKMNGSIAEENDYIKDFEDAQEKFKEKLKEVKILDNDNNKYNDSISDNCECAPYETDALKESSEIYTSIKHSSMKDVNGRTIYRFEDGKNQPLIIVLFKNAEKRLISVNQQVLSLRTFLNIQEMNHVDVDSSSIKTNKHELREVLRATPLVNSGSVKAYSSDNKHNYMFENTTIPLMMMAITVLTEHFNNF